MTDETIAVERMRAAREDRATCWGSRPERPAVCPAVIGCAALCVPGFGREPQPSSSQSILQSDNHPHLSIDYPDEKSIE